MKYLLDTHVFIWWTTFPQRLSPRAKKLISNPLNKLFISTASSWEIEIKMGIGKISFTEPWRAILERELEKNHFSVIPVTLEHTYALQQLPHLHKDPFDRMLIAQALTEQFTIITGDQYIRSYGNVKTEW